jgi:hypothetical protein
VKEETHPAGGLLPDDGSLVFSVRSGQQQSGRGTRRPDHNPPLGTSVLRQGRRVFNELETQHADEKVDRWVIILDHDGDQAEMHHASIGKELAADVAG